MAEITPIMRPLGKAIPSLTALLTTPQAEYLGLPPKPYPPEVQLVTADGNPTDAFHQYLTRDYEWRLRLVNVLLGGP